MDAANKFSLEDSMWTTAWRFHDLSNRALAVATALQDKHPTSDWASDQHAAFMLASCDSELANLIGYHICGTLTGLQLKEAKALAATHKGGFIGALIELNAAFAEENKRYLGIDEIVLFETFALDFSRGADLVESLVVRAETALRDLDK